MDFNIPPILEFDPDPTSVILPGHEKMDIQLPGKAVFAFVGKELDHYAQTHQAEVIGSFDSNTKSYPLYILHQYNEDICLVQAPVGAPAAVQILERLIAYGVKEVISCGSCGTLKKIEENVVLIPYKALRDEGTSYHYVKPERYIELDSDIRQALCRSLERHGFSSREVITWTTDGFYRETKEKVTSRRKEGCAVVEMECAALAACAQLRQIAFGELLFTSDSLADIEKHDIRTRGAASREYVIQLCVEALTL